MGWRRVCRTSIVLIVALALTGATSAPYARADGDPASDFLLGNQVFLTSQSVPVTATQRQLLALVSAANRAGFSIRVAIVPTAYDLGSITPLWRKPGIYARFLGIELSSAYNGRLLVVMPGGLGFNWPGHSSAPDYRLLAAVPVGATPDALAAAVQAAVRRMAIAGGVTLAPVPATSRRAPARSGGRDVAVIAGAAAAALAAMAALGLIVTGRRRRRRMRPRTPWPADRPRQAQLNLVWAVPAVVLVSAAALVTPILLLRRSGVSSAEVASVVTPPPFSWPAGRRPAPAFALRDQDGRPASIGAYRGRPVIVTFIDPLCRNLCPLEAQVLNQAEQQMPASQRPVILAVSVDVYADARADLLQDVREWRLVPQWRWAVGRPAQLAAVWRGYEIGVSVITKHIAGTTIHYITHTEGAYIIDASGHERALFLWPFYPQDVTRVLRQIA
jgi:cytochrome oxidase Cu insertion factor (SCO1/SenC/PrrC family)